MLNSTYHTFSPNQMCWDQWREIMCQQLLPLNIQNSSSSSYWSSLCQSKQCSICGTVNNNPGCDVNSDWLVYVHTFVKGQWWWWWWCKNVVTKATSAGLDTVIPKLQITPSHCPQWSFWVGEKGGVHQDGKNKETIHLLSSNLDVQRWVEKGDVR